MALSLAAFVSEKWPSKQLHDVSSTGGSCQFEVVSHQLYATPYRHSEIRRAAVQYIEANADRYEGLLLPTPEEYIATMSRETTWGDHLTLDALANAYSITIQVAAAFRTPDIILVVPVQPTTDDRNIFVCLYPENHYVSTRPASPVF